MLVLSRHVGENIHIGENIIVTVLDVSLGKASLGIEAPPEVDIFRQELLPKSPHPIAGPGSKVATSQPSPKLIAAAPELLAACKRLLDVRPGYTELTKSEKAVLQLAFAAVAKAEGGGS